MHTARYLTCGYIFAYMIMIHPFYCFYSGRGLYKYSSNDIVLGALIEET